MIDWANLTPETVKLIEFSNQLLISSVNEKLAPHGLQYVGGYVIESEIASAKRESQYASMDFEPKLEDEEFRRIGGTIRFGDDEHLDDLAMRKAKMRGGYLLNMEGCE